jgi:hypothetical protein
MKYSKPTKNNGRLESVDNLGDWDATGNAIKIETTKVLSTWYITAIYSTKRTSLEKYPLENLDTIRDKIL